MTNNDILRRLRYVFDLDDSEMIKIFALGDKNVTRAEVSDWLKRDDDPAYVACIDLVLATFLNGFIIARRGAREGPKPQHEDQLNNNLILVKLRIALALGSDQLLALIQSAGFMISKHELSALFRKPTHRQYRVCKDQILRNFLRGLQLHYRATPSPEETESNGTKDSV